MSAPDPPYSTLIFDLSDVLIAGLWGAEKPLAQRLGVPERSVADALWIPWAFSLFEGRISEKQYLEEVIRRHAWRGISADEVGQLLRQGFLQRVDGMEDLVRALSAKYDLALLSDHAREWVDFIRRHVPVLEVFPHQFFSFELRHTKRERITFLTVLYKLHRSPAECVFVDDLAVNIEVARSVGLRAVQFKDCRQLIAAFRDLGIHAD